LGLFDDLDEMEKGKKERDGWAFDTYLGRLAKEFLGIFLENNVDIYDLFLGIHLYHSTLSLAYNLFFFPL